MNRPSWSLLALPVALLASGCADDPYSLQVLQNQQLLPPACLIQNGLSGMSQSSGTLDVGIVEGGAGLYAGYTVYPLVKNNLVDPSVPAPIISRVDVQLKGVDIQYVLPSQLSAALPASQRAFYQSSYGGNVATLASGAFSAEIVPVQVAVELGSAVPENAIVPMIARFRVVGDQAGGPITSGWVDFPIKLCRWCLTNGKPPLCPKGGLSKASVATGGCNIAQDVDVTCCVSATNHLLCGSAVPTNGM